MNSTYCTCCLDCLLENKKYQADVLLNDDYFSPIHWAAQAKLTVTITYTYFSLNKGATENNKNTQVECIVISTEDEAASLLCISKVMDRTKDHLKNTSVC